MKTKGSPPDPLPKKTDFITLYYKGFFYLNLYLLLYYITSFTLHLFTLHYFHFFFHALFPVLCNRNIVRVFIFYSYTFYSYTFNSSTFFHQESRRRYLKRLRLSVFQIKLNRFQILRLFRIKCFWVVIQARTHKAASK